VATYYTDLTGGSTFRANKLAGISTSNISASVLEDAAKKAYNVINAKLKQRYGSGVPFDTSDPPGIIREISDDLVICYAIQWTKGHAIARTGTIGEMCEAATALLDELATGTARVEGVTVSGALPESTTRGHAPIFERDDVLDHELDSDLADEITDNRDD